MFRNFPLPLFVVVLFMAFSGCKGTPLEDMEAGANLAEKRWAFTELRVSSLILSQDFYAEFEDCERDDYMEFRPGNVLILEEGATKCDPNDPQQTEGTWHLEGNILVITGLDLGLPFTSYTVDLTETTSSTLKGNFKGTLQGISFKGKLALKAL